MNLLPWREIRVINRYQYMIIRLCLYGVLICALLSSMQIIMTHIILRMHTINTVLNHQIEQIVLDKNALTATKHLQRITRIFQLKTAAIQTNTTLLGLLNTTVTALPNNVTLATLSLTKNVIHLSGFSTTLNDIHTYDTNLHALHWQHNTLSDIHHDSTHPATVDFKIQVTA